MANISFKSITFPGLANKYQVPEISNDLMTQGKAADSKKVGDELSEIRADLDTIEDDIKTDGTLTLPEKPADAGAVGDRIFVSLPYAAKEAMLKLFASLDYKNDMSNVYEELREMFGVDNIQYQFFIGYGGNFINEVDGVSYPFGFMRAIQNSKRALVAANYGEHPIKDVNGNDTGIYPIKLPYGIRYVSMLNTIASGHGVSYQIFTWNEDVEDYERIMDTAFYYSEMDGSQFYYDIGAVKDAYIVFVICTASGERERTTPIHGINHAAINTNLDVTDSCKALQIRFV